MIRRRAALAAGFAARAPIGAHSESSRKPPKPIRMIVPCGPGGSADPAARLHANR